MVCLSVLRWSAMTAAKSIERVERNAGTAVIRGLRIRPDSLSVGEAGETLDSLLHGVAGLLPLRNGLLQWLGWIERVLLLLAVAVYYSIIIGEDVVLDLDLRRQ